MKALIFLSIRQVLNGIRRAFSSARRVIGLLFFAAYYVFFFIRPFGQSSSGDKGLRGLEKAFRITETLPVPPLALLAGVVFTGFFILTILQMISSVYYKGGFRRADVDTLFPTPIDRKLVLGMRIFRDTVLAVIVPLLLTVIFARPALSGFSSFVASIPDPNASRYVMRIGFLAFTLHSFAWVGVGYAVSLWASRPEDDKGVRRRAFLWISFLLILGTLGFAGLMFRANLSVETFVAVTQAPWIKVVFFPATWAAAATMAAIQGSWGLVIVYFSLLIAMGSIGIWLALRQAEWAYEIAASTTTATQETVELQRKGDMYGMFAQQARMGKIKSGKSHWMMSRTMPREWALMWKEIIHMSRTGIVLHLIPMILGLFLVIMMGLIPDRNNKAPDFFLLFGVGMTSFVGATILQGGFVELMRRGDLVKPFPFAPGRVVYYETIAHSLPVMASILVVGLTAIVMKPAVWATGLTSLVGGPLFCLAITSIMVMTTLLFPDIDDPTQRGFRGLMQLLSMVVLLAPGIGVFAAAMFLKWGIPVAILLMALVNLLVTVICSSVSGRLYANFNPTE